MRFFAANPVYGHVPQLKPRQLVAPKPLAKAGHPRRARQPFIILFKLHARHFTSPGWTNTVQPKLLFCSPPGAIRILLAIGRTMNGSPEQIYEMHPMGRSSYWLTCAFFALACGVTALIVSVRVSDGHWVIGGLGILFLFAGFHMFVRPQTVVEPDTRIVRRQFQLFGRFLLLNRQYAFSDFAAVIVRPVRGSNMDNDPGQFLVSLRRRSGRPILIRYFEADTARGCRPAEELAHKLSADLQIEIEEQDA
jgi:hypothetical protein